jgi:hypothetical protein
MPTLALVLALATTVAPAPAAKAAARPAARGEAPWTEEERSFCAAELEALEKRTRLFEAQRLPEPEIARRNASAAAAVADCRRRFVAAQRRLRDEREDLEELDRRTHANATELEREQVWRQIRRERLSSRSPSSLTEEERAELQAGSSEELRETHDALDSAHARDRGFMRQVHSALACYHGGRRESVAAELAHEESLVKLGTGDRTRVYGLKSQLRESEDVLERSREAARTFPEGLLRCSDPQTAVLAHCLGVAFEGKDAEPACESEAIQQYVRFIK